MMNKRLYGLAGIVVILGALSMGAVAYLQGDFKDLGRQPTKSVSEVVQISLSDNTSQSSSKAVEISGNQVTIIAGGQYRLSGQAGDVSVSVPENISGDVTILLSNAHFAHLDIQSKGTNILDLEEGSSNSLTGGESGIRASNLTLTGSGSLDITNVSQYGIFTMDDLVIESGDYKIESAGSGLYSRHETESKHGNLTINGGSLLISSSTGEGAALFASNNLTLNKGQITVEESHEGYVAKSLSINGGSSKINSMASGMVARATGTQDTQATEVKLAINGGTNTIMAGANPILANGDIEISGGVNTLLGSTPEQAALNYTGKAQLTGGTLIALGLVEFSKTDQSYFTANLSANAGDTVTVTDAAGNEVANYLTPVAFSHLTYSTVNLKTNETYFLSTTSGNYGQAVANYISVSTP